MAPHISPSTRKQCDFTKLLMAGYELELQNGDSKDFHVTFHGPKDSAYEGGIWKVHVILPEDYPYASPSISFVNKILHPNVDEASGSVCLDVINQTWTPVYSLVNVFDIFLPQLLIYPNPQDPLNSDAASLLLRDKSEYNDRVKEYVKTYASCLSPPPDPSVSTGPSPTPHPPSQEGRSTCSTASSHSQQQQQSPLHHRTKTSEGTQSEEKTEECIQGSEGDPFLFSTLNRILHTDNFREKDDDDILMDFDEDEEDDLLEDFDDD